MRIVVGETLFLVHGHNVALVGSGLDLEKNPGVGIAHLLPRNLDAVGRGEELDDLVDSGLRLGEHHLERSGLRLGRFYKLVVAGVADEAGRILLHGMACGGCQQHRATSCDK